MEWHRRVVRTCCDALCLSRVLALRELQPGNKCVAHSFSMSALVETDYAGLAEALRSDHALEEKVFSTTLCLLTLLDISCSGKISSVYAGATLTMLTSSLREAFLPWLYARASHSTQ